MDLEDQKYASVHYADYLRIDQLLSAQNMRSKELNVPAHDEMLFIIVHQVYELWFKEILHDVGSVMEMFQSESVDERNIGTALHRLERVSEILLLLIQQIKVLETMTPLDFLDFRNYLFPASGFQSHQFRMIEVKLGLKIKQRQTYHNTPYQSVFTQKLQEELQKAETDPSLFELIESWLERTPFVDRGDYQFIPEYRLAVEKMLAREKKAIMDTPILSDKEKEMRIKMQGDTETYFATVMNEDAHNKMIEDGTVRLSYKATLSALFISLYRDEPVLHSPFRLLNQLIEIDELLTTWRYRHAQMVLRMIGRKVGTGGSSGFEYLLNTALKHQIFVDFHNISTLMIPRSDLPELPETLKNQLAFHFTINH